MRQQFWLAHQYFKYRLKAVDAHGIHPPFLFELYNQVFGRSKQISAPVSTFKQWRAQMLNNHTSLPIIEFGAGSKRPANEKTVAQIASISGSSVADLALLYRLCAYFQPKHILEFGTNLGLASAALQLAHREAQITTLEANPYFVDFVHQWFSQIHCSNIQVVQAQFDDFIAQKTCTADFIYIDGNHTFDATLRYYEWALNDNPNALITVVLDDIRWSADMYKAWLQIVQSTAHQLTLDLFDKGIVIKKSGLSRQFFTLKT